MEWMLQVVDEVDDAIGAVKHRWLGLRIELGLLRLQSFCTALAAVGAVFAVGFGSASAAPGAAFAAGFVITMAAFGAAFATGVGTAS